MKYYTSKGFVEKRDETLNDKTKKQAAAITFLSLALALALAIGAWLYTDYVYGDEEDSNGEATKVEAVSEDNGSGGEAAPAKEAVKDNSNVEAVQVQQAEPQREEVQRVEAAPVEEKVITEEEAVVKEEVKATPVEKVTVKIHVRKNSGYSVAQTWTAVANGSNNWKQAKNAANQYSPITEGLTTYTFTGEFKDELGNTWSGDRFYGKDFIALFEGQEGPTATMNVYAQYSESHFPKLTVIGNDEVSTGSFSWSNDGAFSEYTKTFSEPDEVEGWTFLYWEGEDGEQYEDGDEWTIEASDLDGDTTVVFTAIWEQDEEDPVIDPDDEDVDDDDDAEFETIYTETIKVKTEAKTEAKTVDSPATGDGHPILGWTIIFILALAGTLGGIFRKKN